MTDASLLPSVFGGLAFAHIWQSVALAAVLAGALILGRKLSGAARYALAAASFLACLALPLAAFFPAEKALSSTLAWLDAPVSLQPAPPQATVTETQPADAVQVSAVSPSGFAGAALKLGADAARAAISAEASPTDAALPAWAIETGARLAAADLAAPVGEPVHAPAVETVAAPLFTLPDLNLPNLTLPLLLVWLAGTVLMLVRTGRDLIAVERLVANARTIDLPPSLKARMKGVRVAISAEAPGPMAAGLLRPCVVLPESAAAQLNSPGMAALLEHERAHIERYDMAVALAQRIVLAALWWSPALHWISRRIDEEREVACDEAAVERTGDPRAFARSLTTQAENQLWARAPRLAVGAIGPRSQVGRRIRRLIDAAKSGGASARYSGRLAFSGLVVVAALAAIVTPTIVFAQESPEGVEDRDLNEDQRTWVDRLDGGRSGWQFAFHTPPEPPAPPSALEPVAPLPPVPPMPPEVDAELQALGLELELLMKDLSVELDGAFADMPPGLEGELAGLSSELAGLGAEIAGLVSAELARELPMAMAQVRVALNDVDWDEHGEEVRAALEEARLDLQRDLGPEFREELRTEIRTKLEEARHEIAAHREEIAAAAVEQREAIAEARREIARARAEHAERDAEVARELSDADREAAQTQRLTSAATRGDLAEIRRLLADGADPNRHISGRATPLAAAVRAGELAAVRTLVEAGADVNRSYGSGRNTRTPLGDAIRADERAIADYLRSRGAVAPADGSN